VSGTSNDAARSGQQSQQAKGADVNELWSRSVASVYDGKVEDFKRLAEDLLSAIREHDSDTLNYAIFLDEPARVAVIIEQYASSAGWLAHNANLGPLTPRFAEVCEVTAIEFYGDPTPEARAALNGLGARYYPTLLAL
jgi:quinol monooxygenase YgiN